MVKKIFAKGFIYLMLLLMYAPIILLIIFSFVEFDHIDFRQLVSGENINFNLYKELFTGEDGETVVQAFKNTLLVAVVSAMVSTILGTFAAIGMYYSGKKMRKAYEIGGQIPILNPEIITALSLTILFVFVGIQFNFITLLIGHVVLTIPFVVLSILPKLKQMDNNIYEAALDLGAKPSKALTKIIIPQIMPGILSGFILAVTLSLDDYIITAFTRNNSFVTLSTYVYGVTSKRGAIPPTLRALTTIIVVVTLIVLLIINFTSGKKPMKKRGTRV
ncbi:MAG: ABC transporter permease [Bacilli bacterium]|nr:ABC transporter permease [Bacilli bacterium]